MTQEKKNNADFAFFLSPLLLPHISWSYEIDWTIMENPIGRMTWYYKLTHRGFPGNSDGKETACNAGALGLIPGSGRSPGEGNDYPLQCSCLENPMDRGAWWATVHRTAGSWTWLSTHSHTTGFLVMYRFELWVMDKPLGTQFYFGF